MDIAPTAHESPRGLSHSLSSIYQTEKSQSNLGFRRYATNECKTSLILKTAERVYSRYLSRLLMVEGRGETSQKTLRQQQASLFDLLFLFLIPVRM